MKRTKKLLAVILILVTLISSVPLCASATLSNLTWSQYKTKYQSFINDSRWSDKSTWSYGQRPKLSSWSSQGCCAYAADFTKYVFDAPNQKSGDVFYNPSEIRAGDVIYIYNSDRDQHWFVVLERNGNTLYTAEGNYAGKIYVLSTRYAVNGNTLKNGKNTFKGYHYLKPENANQSSQALAADFYAEIRKTDSWTPVYNNSGSVEFKKTVKDARSLWHFVKNQDESYAVINAADGSCLDASGLSQSNTYLKTAAANGSDSQKWLIENNGFVYRLKPKSNSKYSVCAKDNNSSDGVKLCLSNANSDESQKFSLYILGDNDILPKSVLSVKAGNNDTETVFTWTFSNQASGYRLKIYNGSSLYGSYEMKMNEDGVRSKKIVLPDGSYKAVIESFNSFKSAESNAVIFTIGCPHTHTTVTHKAVSPTCTKAGSTEGIKCTDCGKILKEPQTIEKNGHSYKKKTTKATLSADGKTVKTCKVCGKKKTTAVIYSPKIITLEKEIYTYSGSECRPLVTVTDSNGSALATSNYTVKYENNINVGTATVTVTFVGNYSGTVKKVFKIRPRKSAILSLKASANGFTADWKKRTKQAEGYEIRYATSKKFTKKTRQTFTVTNKNTVSRTFGGLKGGKRYYVKIRTYKVVGGQKYYSAWSDVCSIKTEK